MLSFLFLCAICIFGSLFLAGILYRGIKTQSKHSIAVPCILGAVIFAVCAIGVMALCSFTCKNSFSLENLSECGYLFCGISFFCLYGGIGWGILSCYRHSARIVRLIKHPIQSIGHFYQNKPKIPLNPCSQFAQITFAIGGLLFLSFFCETILFNWRAYENYTEELPVSTFYYSDFMEVEGATLEGQSYVIGENGAFFELFLFDQEIHSVSLEVHNMNHIFEVSIGIEDKSSSYQNQNSIYYPMQIHSLRSTNIGIHSNGDAKKLQLSFAPSANGVYLYSVTINKPTLFSFLFLRFFILLGILVSSYLILHFKLYRILLHPGSVLQRAGNAILVTSMLLLCCFTFLSSYSADTEHTVVYEPDKKYEDVYHEMFDALMKQQLHLDLVVDPRLNEIENPYDPSALNNEQIPYEFDRVFYNGKYYSYFGLTPLFCVYLPFYLLTGVLPDSATVCLFLACFFVVGCWLLYKTFLRVSGIRPAYLIFALGYIACCLCSNVFWALRRPYFYEVAAISAIAFCCWFFYFLLKAVWSHPLYFIPAAICCVLAVMSRPNMALYCGAAAILLLWYFLHRNRQKKKKILYLSIFFGIGILGAGILFAYNYLRFGSPLQFGASYQLTVSDINYNSVFQLGYFFPALFHYVLQPPYLSLQFPFISVSGYQPVNFGNYYFNNYCLGLAFYPVTLLAPFGVYLRTGKKRTFSFLRLFKLILLLTAVAMIYIITAVGGVLYRYTIDFAFFIVLFGVMGACRFTSQKNVSAYRYGLIVLLLILSILPALALSLTGEYNFFANNNPTWFMNLKMAFEWWR